MDHNVTVSVKSILLAGLVVLALVTAYLLGNAGGDPVAAPASAAPQEQPAAEDRRTVRMVGTGEATAVPDEVTFGLTVTSKRFDLDDALAASNVTMRRVLTTLRRYGVREADVQTTGLSMYPEYDYNDSGPPTLTGYRVSQRAQVRVRELTRAGKAISAAVEAGGNDVRVRDIRLALGDPDAVLAKARDAAVKEATAKAEQYADATGQELGAVASIREVGSAAQRGYLAQAGGMMRSSMYDARDLAAFPIRAGKDDLKVRIEVVWSFG